MDQSIVKARLALLGSVVFADDLQLLCFSLLTCNGTRKREPRHQTGALAALATLEATVANDERCDI